MQPESGHAHPHHSCVLVTAFLSQVSEAARELGLATAEEDSILQNELPCQEAPAEHHPQNPPSSSDESSSDESSYSTCPEWE